MLNVTFTKLVKLLVVFSGICAEINALNDENDLKLTLTEHNALEELKSQVSNYLTEEFMKSDFYLIRWLRRANSHVQHAKNMLLNTISWRKEHNITNILYEDFYDLEQDYHMSFEGEDKQGRPLLEIDLGDWDLRAVVIQGKIRRLQRYLTYSTERIMQNIFRAQEQGKHVTRHIVLVDANGVNLRQQGCALCISFLVQWVLEKEMHYPDFTDETIIINAPNIGQIILNAVRAAVSPELNSQIRSFDSNKVYWMKYLDARIERDQRSSRYGGTAVKAR